MKTLIFSILIGIGFCHEPIEQFKIQIKKKCEVVGGHRAYEQLTGPLNESMHLMTQVIEEELQNLRKSGASRTEIQFASRACTKLTEIKNCQSIVRNSAKICLNDTEKENYDAVVDIYQKLYEYKCLTAKKALNFIDTTDYRWLYHLDVTNCTSIYFGNTALVMITSGILSIPTCTTICKNIDKFKECLLEPRPLLNTPDIKNYMMADLDQLVTFVKNRSDCKGRNLRRKRRNAFSELVRDIMA